MTGPIIAFGPVAFDPSSGRLRGNGTDISLGHRAAALLQTLITADQQPVPKSALLEAAWPGMVVEEGNLTVQIAALRKALGTRPDGQDWIVTVPRVGYRLVREQPAKDQDESTLPTVAVLPFLNLSGDIEQDYFADGIVEDIITALSRFKAFAVIARNSTFAYKGRAIDAREIALQLGAAYLVEGSVRRAGNRLRITAQLVDGASGAHLWAQNFDGPTDDIFDMQDRITASVVALVEPKIQTAEIERSWRRRPESLVAYDYYLRGSRKLINNGDADNRAGLALLEQAIALEPGYALALAAAANGYESRVTTGWEPASADDRVRAMELARAALEITRDDALVLAHCGIVMQAMGNEYDQGLLILRRALEVNPNDVFVMFQVAVGHMWGGELDAAMDLFHRIIRVSPGATYGAMTGVAHVLLCLGKFEEALPWAAKALAEQPNFAVTHWVLIAAYAHLGRLDEARHALAAVLALEPGSSLGKIAHHTKDPKRTTVMIDGLRMAGMPE